LEIEWPKVDCARITATQSFLSAMIFASGAKISRIAADA